MGLRYNGTGVGPSNSRKDPEPECIQNCIQHVHLPFSVRLPYLAELKPNSNFLDLDHLQLIEAF